MKKTLKFFFAFILAIGIMGTASVSEASAASTAAMIKVGQTQTKSSTITLTKNLNVKVANSSPTNGAVNVSVVNSITGVVVSRNVPFNNNKLTNILTMNSITPGVYHIVLTCIASPNNFCQASATLQGT